MSHHYYFVQLRRRAIKKFIKLTHKESDWYKIDYWPDIKVTGKKVLFRRKPLNIQLFSDMSLDLNKEPTVNIIGSGPSVKNLDMSKLHNHSNIFLNL